MASNHWSLAVVVNASHWKSLIPGKTRESTKRIVADSTEKKKPFIVHLDSCKGTHTAEFVAEGIKELLRYFNQETFSCLTSFRDSETPSIPSSNMPSLSGAHGTEPTTWLRKARGLRKSSELQ
jgi:hypothetical protein